MYVEEPCFICHGILFNRHNSSTTIKIEHISCDQICDIIKIPWIENGLATTFWSNSQKKIEVNYIDCLPDGLYQRWYENGQKAVQYYYEEGIVYGLYQRWYENGQKRLEVNYINGLIDGLVQEWYPNGQKIYEYKYVNGHELDLTNNNCIIV